MEVSVVPEHLAAGDQVYVDYGRGATKCSWEHLFSHGFVPQVSLCAVALCLHGYVHMHAKAYYTVAG